MLSNLQIILVAGAALLFLVILYLFFRPLFTRKLIQNSLDDSSSMLFQEGVEQGTLGFEDEDEAFQEQELIILNLVSMDKSNFDMNQVLTLLKNLDAKYVNGFFSYRDLGGREIYRIASGINPGLLDSDTQTHVLLMALDLYQAIDPVKAFETMLESASGISEKLHASICDSARAPLSKQMIEHLKSRAQEISHLKSMRSISEK
ncbi:cell division protein ZipA C-terminal FtsZ-binding domain-containing protein [Gammaproteobacteria bacterium]|jgi:FtsZ-interacting cell division protein ZipA|nr:cell division protein ZipA C-terminal FtsZ-binding domain-containing protein [Gammaproteobacteria bacterium]|tara:strand:- start:598 stop:1209 length:612 start_codon:yes stop_codon:yes gene_type:complete